MKGGGPLPLSSAPFSNNSSSSSSKADSPSSIEDTITSVTRVPRKYNPLLLSLHSRRAPTVGSVNSANDGSHSCTSPSLSSLSNPHPPPPLVPATSIYTPPILADSREPSVAHVQAPPQHLLPPATPVSFVMPPCPHCQPHDMSWPSSTPLQVPSTTSSSSSSLTEPHTQCSQHHAPPHHPSTPYMMYTNCTPCVSLLGTGIHSDQVYNHPAIQYYSYLDQKAPLPSIEQTLSVVPQKAHSEQLQQQSLSSDHQVCSTSNEQIALHTTYPKVQYYSYLPQKASSVPFEQQSPSVMPQEVSHQISSSSSSPQDTTSQGEQTPATPSVSSSPNTTPSYEHTPPHQPPFYSYNNPTFSQTAPPLYEHPTVTPNNTSSLSYGQNPFPPSYNPHATPHMTYDVQQSTTPLPQGALPFYEQTVSPPWYNPHQASLMPHLSSAHCVPLPNQSTVPSDQTPSHTYQQPLPHPFHIYQQESAPSPTFIPCSSTIPPLDHTSPPQSYHPSAVSTCCFRSDRTPFHQYHQHSTPLLPPYIPQDHHQPTPTHVHPTYPYPYPYPHPYPSPQSVPPPPCHNTSTIPSQPPLRYPPFAPYSTPLTPIAEYAPPTPPPAFRSSSEHPDSLTHDYQYPPSPPLPMMPEHVPSLADTTPPSASICTTYDNSPLSHSSIPSTSEPPSSGHPPPPPPPSPLTALDKNAKDNNNERSPSPSVVHASCCQPAPTSTPKHTIVPVPPFRKKLETIESESPASSPPPPSPKGGRGLLPTPPSPRGSPHTDKVLPQHLKFSSQQPPPPPTPSRALLPTPTHTHTLSQTLSQTPKPTPPVSPRDNRQTTYHPPRLLTRTSSSSSSTLNPWARTFIPKYISASAGAGPSSSTPPHQSSAPALLVPLPLPVPVLVSIPPPEHPPCENASAF
eukprot:CAMPEP_0184653428 /NCGR_PEP_ID=MMETSP0308-20130426/11149_1 /TAXON_ID=38269 /ORGANISM="Gloeochaete witrockiana, Strain SAG 46.84" /LENGTH=903 /DNA_ID=CAMNT_0027088879 /DNA_START=122 /DNA_END=2830 /DNA_ORIENTATION=-